MRVPPRGVLVPLDTAATWSRVTFLRHMRAEHEKRWALVHFIRASMLVDEWATPSVLTT